MTRQDAVPYQPGEHLVRSVGRWLVGQMAAHKTSARQTALACDLSEATIHRIIRDGTDLTFDTLSRLATLYGMEPGEVLTMALNGDGPEVKENTLAIRLQKRVAGGCWLPERVQWMYPAKCR